MFLNPMPINGASTIRTPDPADARVLARCPQTDYEIYDLDGAFAFNHEYFQSPATCADWLIANNYAKWVELCAHEECAADGRRLHPGEEAVIFGDSYFEDDGCFAEWLERNPDADVILAKGKVG